jgi:DNA-binding NarL/FixJ family response regulator
MGEQLHRRPAATVTTGVSELTEREFEILALVAGGLSNEGIARALIISRRTVDAHVRAIFLKLDLSSDPLRNQRARAVMTYWRGRAEHSPQAA